MFKLLTMFTVLAVATAKTVEEKQQIESPLVQLKNPHFPDKGWEISDWLVGVVMGGYGPLVSYARDGDCFSSWFAWGTATIEFSKYFDRNFDTKSWTAWTSLVISLFFFTKESVNLPQVCADELKYAKDTQWHKNFGFLADIKFPKVPYVQNYSRDSVSFNVFRVIGLLLGSLKVYGEWQSEFWFWGLGHAMGTLASVLFIGIDVWADAGLITPTPARIRYLDN